MKLGRIRTGVQTFWLLFLNSTLPLKFFDFPVLNCYSCPLAATSCPLGALQHFFALRRLPFYVAGELGVAGVLGGGLSCGWACPFGFFQDALYKLPTKKFKLDFKSAEALRFMFLALMILLLFGAVLARTPLFCKLCPAGSLEAAIPIVATEASLRRRIGMLFYLKLAVLLKFVVLAVVSKRPFCRFACPLGAILSAFNPLSGVRLEVDELGCVRCERCEAVCPMRIKIYETPNSTRCIRCLKCLDACEGGHIHVRFELTQGT